MVKNLKYSRSNREFTAALDKKKKKSWESLAALSLWASLLNIQNWIPEGFLILASKINNYWNNK